MPKKMPSFTNSVHYSREYQRFRNTTPSMLLDMGWRERFSVAWEILFQTEWRIPMERLPEATPDWQAFLKPQAKTRFIWFGHSTLLLNVAGNTVLIDPVFSPSAAPFPFKIRRFQPPVLPIETLPPIDLIVISHNHYDHLDKETIAFFRDKKTKIIVPLGLSNTLRKWGFSANRITECDWFETFILGDASFTATPARHSSGRGLFDHNQSFWCSWVIDSPADRLFFSGDSGYESHFREIAETYGPFDVAFVENGQYNRRWPDSHMSPEQTIQAVRDLAPRTFVPIHWGMFTLALHHWTEPVNRSYQLAQSHGINFVTPRFGEVTDTDVLPTTPLWWQEYVPDDEKPDATF